MNFVKIITSDGETRWINLAQVSRVTTATESQDEPLLAVMFADANPEAVLKIHGTDDVNREAIRKFTTALNDSSV